MQINQVVPGLAAGVGIDLSPDNKTAFYVEWSIGELNKVDVGTGAVTTIRTGLSFPQDVEVDWNTGEIFVSERTGAILSFNGREKRQLLNLGGAPHQLDLKKTGAKRFLYTVCFDSGQLIRVDVDAKTIDIIAGGLRHPIGLVIDAGQKNAYVTEQDTGTLSRIRLSDGSRTQLFSGLISPFFLAWDKNATGIFCAQRDPANNLIRLDLGASTVTIVANGLPWRPSGVAPSSDNKFIYVSSDQELDVISFNGPPAVIASDPPFTVESIQFYLEKPGSIRLKNHLTSSYLSLPEFVQSSRNEPAAYIAGTKPKVRVIFRKRASFVLGAYDIGATGSLGGIRRKTVAPVFNPSGLSNPVEFEFMWPLQGTVGKPDVSLNWYARQLPGASVPATFSPSIHRIYIILSKPTAPWIAEPPWVGALEIACGWANGTATIDEAASGITVGYFNSGKVSYDTSDGDTFYGATIFHLTEMIDRLNGGPGLGLWVNCTDSANTVATLSNLLGCNLWEARMGIKGSRDGFDLNPIQGIGSTAWEAPFGANFSYHEVAWKGACGVGDQLFDGCLCVDGDAVPGSPPHVTMQPVNIVFGDCSAMNYRLRLCKNTPGGCAQCPPTPSSRVRRAID